MKKIVFFLVAMALGALIGFIVGAEFTGDAFIDCRHKLLRCTEEIDREHKQRQKYRHSPEDKLEEIAGLLLIAHHLEWASMMNRHPHRFVCAGIDNEGGLILDARNDPNVADCGFGVYVEIDTNKLE